VPGEEPHVVLRRRELGKDGKYFTGQIDVSREQVFDAIDEWHQGHVHMGQERTWTFWLRKRANLIAYKLQEIFGIIGYPNIFHTDNGKSSQERLCLNFFGTSTQTFSW
jgi:hypothetical protein